ncbi:hypothetical protein CDL15_Pgr025227 [Punica granatum]|uniref:Uncharacterized protein n=1 Tax=Punica granatum TaxID=22663 RepID=A0A218W9M2_PUNGR|nr:hypothetical protein CDL15_Pgr025227 [Punica granatum]PKI73365.1 hypothetical protein CRG98_006303 [Punica granatum]
MRARESIVGRARCEVSETMATLKKAQQPLKASEIKPDSPPEDLRPSHFTRNPASTVQLTTRLAVSPRVSRCGRELKCARPQVPVSPMALSRANSLTEATSVARASMRY